MQDALADPLRTDNQLVNEAGTVFFDLRCAECKKVVGV